MKVFLLFAMAGAACAGVLNYSTGGTFDSGQTSDSPYFLPNTSWTLTFTVQDPPVEFTSYSGPTLTYFGTNFANAVYTVGGSQVILTGTEIYFYASQMFDLCLDSNCDNQIGLGGPALYSGAVDTPTLLTGVFTSTSSQTSYYIPTQDLPIQYNDGPVTVTVTDPSAAAPEPGSLAMICAGMLSAAFMTWRRRRPRAAAVIAR